MIPMTDRSARPPKSQSVGNLEKEAPASATNAGEGEVEKVQPDSASSIDERGGFVK